MTINDIKSGVGYMDYAYSKYIVIPTLPLWHKIKVTPNILTTFGLISSVLFIYFLWKRNVVLAIVFLLLRQYFDYADGLLARKYKQISNFGDWYDHIVDSVFVMLPLILLILFHTKKRIIYLCLLIPAILATIINIGCIEKNYKNSNNKGRNSLKFLQEMCFSEELFKIFDNSFLYIIIIIISILICREKK